METNHQNIFWAKCLLLKHYTHSFLNISNGLKGTLSMKRLVGPLLIKQNECMKNLFCSFVKKVSHALSMCLSNQIKFIISKSDHIIRFEKKKSFG